MARPRKNDPTQIINPILQEFAMRIAKSVEKFALTRITDEVQKVLTQPVRRAPGERRRALVRCFVLDARFADRLERLSHQVVQTADETEYRPAHQTPGLRVETPIDPVAEQGEPGDSTGKLQTDAEITHPLRVSPVSGHRDLRGRTASTAGRV